MGYFRKNEIKSAKQTPTPLYKRTPFPEILDPPLKLHYWNGLKSEFHKVLEKILSVVCLEDLRGLIEKWYELNHVLYFIRIACLI